MIDTHVHLGGGKYASVEEWRAASDRNGIEASVLVQNLGNRDNAELLAAGAARDRFAVIAIPETVDVAQGILEAGAVGFRLSPQGLHSAPGQEIFDVLREAGGIASITGPFEQVSAASFASLVDNYPEVHFRIEHVGGFPYGEHDDSVAGFAPVLRLAERANVSLMWSGFFHFSRSGYPYRDAWPVLEQSLIAFGAARIHWSGDWNRVGGTDQTYNADQLLLAELPFVDEYQIEQIGRLTARRIFWKD